MRAPEAFPLSHLLSLSSFHPVCLLLSLLFPPSVTWWSAEYCPPANLLIFQYPRNTTRTFIVIYLSYLNYLCWLPVMPEYLTQGVYSCTFFHSPWLYLAQSQYQIFLNSSKIKIQFFLSYFLPPGYANLSFEWTLTVIQRINSTLIIDSTEIKRGFMNQIIHQLWRKKREHSRNK